MGIDSLTFDDPRNYMGLGEDYTLTLDWGTLSCLVDMGIIWGLGGSNLTFGGSRSDLGTGEVIVGLTPQVRWGVRLTNDQKD